MIKNYDYDYDSDSEAESKSNAKNTSLWINLNKNVIDYYWWLFAIIDHCSFIIDDYFLL